MDARIATVWFKTDYTPRYDVSRLLCAYSASAADRGIDLEIHELDRLSQARPQLFMEENAEKLHCWRQLVESTNQPLILTDADMLMVGDPREGFDQGQWDIGITCRDPRNHRTLNGGVVYVRPTEGAREFMRVWCEVNGRMLHNPIQYRDWCRMYAGMNQSALGLMLDSGLVPEHCTVGYLDAARWNCCCEALWNSTDPDSIRLLHVKGTLRERILNPSADDDRIGRLAAIWREYDPLCETVASG